MASRILSRRLLHLRQSSASCSLLHPRRFSAKGEAIEPNNPESGAAKPEQLSPMLAVFEDMIHGMIVQRCEPEWLPFVPGSSFWVPPRPKSGSFIKQIEKLSVVNRTLSDEETMSLTTMRGWPSSSFYVIKGNESDLSKSDKVVTEETETVVANGSSSENKED